MADPPTSPVSKRLVLHAYLYPLCKQIPAFLYEKIVASCFSRKYHFVIAFTKFLCSVNYFVNLYLPRFGLIFLRSISKSRIPDIAQLHERLNDLFSRSLPEDEATTELDALLKGIVYRVKMESHIPDNFNIKWWWKTCTFLLDKHVSFEKETLFSDITIRLLTKQAEHLSLHDIKLFCDPPIFLVYSREGGLQMIHFANRYIADKEVKRQIKGVLAASYVDEWAHDADSYNDYTLSLLVDCEETDLLCTIVGSLVGYCKMNK